MAEAVSGSYAQPVHGPLMIAGYFTLTEQVELYSHGDKSISVAHPLPGPFETRSQLLTTITPPLPTGK
jgi:hypothetical protein